MDSNDHRAIGNRLDLFHQQDEAPGMVFWHPRGPALYRVLENCGWPLSRWSSRRSAASRLSTPAASRQSSRVGICASWWTNGRRVCLAGSFGPANEGSPCSLRSGSERSVTAR
jgi:hypothetical protein